MTNCSGSRLRGFTLIELLIVVAVIGILAAIAYPAYTSAVRKANRSAAQSFMMDVAARQSQHLLDRRAYGANFAALGQPVPTKVSDFYGTPTMTVVAPSAGTAPSFTITADPKAGTIQVGDPTLTLNSAGAKTPAEVW